MALQAGCGSTGGKPEQSNTLDIETFWGKPTVYPKRPIEKWKRRFIVGLLAKTMIAFDEVIRHHTEPELFYAPDESAPLDRIETKAPEEQRLERRHNRDVRKRRLHLTRLGNTGRRAQHQD